MLSSILILLTPDIMIRVLITDDHPIVRQGIRQILEDDPEKRFGEIEEAGNSRELFSLITEKEFNVLLLDISLPGRSGLDILPDIKRLRPGLQVLIVSIYREEQYAMRALRLGASGYLMKSGAPEELLTATFRVAQNLRYIAPELAEKIAFNTVEEIEKPLHEQLSEREIQVVCLIAEGMTTADIARKLSLSPKTISTYRERILVKLNLRTTSDIIRFALREGLAGDVI